MAEKNMRDSLIAESQNLIEYMSEQNTNHGAMIITTDNPELAVCIVIHAGPPDTVKKIIDYSDSLCACSHCPTNKGAVCNR